MLLKHGVKWAPSLMFLAKARLRWRETESAIDIRNEALRHYDEGGIKVPDFEMRVRTCALYIGLDGMTYQAWKGLWTDLEATADRTMSVLRA